MELFKEHFARKTAEGEAAAREGPPNRAPRRRAHDGVSRRVLNGPGSTAADVFGFERTPVIIQDVEEEEDYNANSVYGPDGTIARSRMDVADNLPDCTAEDEARDAAREAGLPRPADYLQVDPRARVVPVTAAQNVQTQKNMAAWYKQTHPGSDMPVATEEVLKSTNASILRVFGRSLEENAEVKPNPLRIDFLGKEGDPIDVVSQDTYDIRNNTYQEIPKHSWPWLKNVIKNEEIDAGLESIVQAGRSGRVPGEEFEAASCVYESANKLWLDIGVNHGLTVFNIEYKTETIEVEVRMVNDKLPYSLIIVFEREPSNLGHVQPAYDAERVPDVPDGTRAFHPDVLAGMQARIDTLRARSVRDREAKYADFARRDGMGLFPNIYGCRDRVRLMQMSYTGLNDASASAVGDAISLEQTRTLGRR